MPLRCAQLERPNAQHTPPPCPAPVCVLQHKVPDKLTDPTSVTQIHSITKQIGMLATGMHGRPGAEAGCACQDVGACTNSRGFPE